MPIDDFATPVDNPIANHVYAEAPHYYYATTTGDIGPIAYDRYQQTLNAEAGHLNPTAISSIIEMIDTKIEIAMMKQQQNLYRIISEHCGIDISMDEFIKLLQGK